jgi:hypothetical protein
MHSESVISLFHYGLFKMEWSAQLHRNVHSNQRCFIISTNFQQIIGLIRLNRISLKPSTMKRGLHPTALFLFCIWENSPGKLQLDPQTGIHQVGHMTVCLDIDAQV